MTAIPLTLFNITLLPWKNLIKNKGFILFWTLSLFLVIRSQFPSDGEADTDQFKYLFYTFCFFNLIYWSVKLHEHDFTPLIRLIPFISILYALSLIIQWHFFKTDTYTRLTGYTQLDHQAVVTGKIFAFLSITNLSIATHSSVAKKWALSATILCVYCLILSQSRGPLAAFLVSCPILAFLKVRHNKMQLTLLFALFIAISASTLYTLKKHALFQIISRTNISHNYDISPHKNSSLSIFRIKNTGSQPVHIKNLKIKNLQQKSRLNASIYNSSTKSTVKKTTDSYTLQRYEILVIRLDKPQNLNIRFTSISQSKNPLKDYLVYFTERMKDESSHTIILSKKTPRAFYFDSSLGGRTTIWKELIRQWQENPSFGRGNEIKTHHFQTPSGLHDSHSLAFGLLYKGGFIALILYLLLFIHIIYISPPSMRTIMICLFIFVNLDDHLLLFKLRPFWIYLILPLFVTVSLKKTNRTSPT
ncbi:O-antigen ligase family protein [Lentisphaera profundi]|uniref:O-antigen ligase family protein n=1 Tax=Lentisphaera profundi TaxID=1658616 RepID=A0ABY7W161_9BACT|nr:O-antigen ligase family protein [Lentisphaera profundi]WDE99160.1 O-antigen ligase family protein [Lentisphaera profundi]